MNATQLSDLNEALVDKGLSVSAIACDIVVRLSNGRAVGIPMMWATGKDVDAVAAEFEAAFASTPENVVSGKFG